MSIALEPGRVLLQSLDEYCPGKMRGRCPNVGDPLDDDDDSDDEGDVKRMVYGKLAVESAKKARKREREMAKKGRKIEEKVNKSTAEIRQMQAETLQWKWTERPETDPDEYHLPPGKDWDVAAEADYEPRGSERIKSRQRPGRYPVTVKGNVCAYVSWAFMDLKGLNEQLSSLNQRGQKWITAFEEQTAGHRLALGDLKAILSQTKIIIKDGSQRVTRWR
ncbi:uncharacterized protein LOC111190061 [Arapaima gigas]